MIAENAELRTTISAQTATIESQEQELARLTTASEALKVVNADLKAQNLIIKESSTVQSSQLYMQIQDVERDRDGIRSEVDKLNAKIAALELQC